MRPKDPFIGREILGGEYLVLEKIGTGGMGKVYGARHPVIGKRAAIKVLHASYCADRAAVGRFVQEAQAAQRIVTIRCPAGFLVDANGDHDERGACQIRIVPVFTLVGDERGAP